MCNGQEASVPVAKGDLLVERSTVLTLLSINMTYKSPWIGLDEAIIAAMIYGNHKIH